MGDVASREAQINAFIEKSVQNFWAERSQALLLSYLGSNLKNVFPDSDAILGRGLRRHLQTWPIATLVAHPTQREKIGLIPLNVPLPSDVTTLFAEPKHYAPRPRSDLMLFRQDFWNLFLTPIRSRKFIVITGDQNFLITDSLPQNPVEGTAYELHQDDVVTAPQETPSFEKAKLARDKIEAWLQRHGLDRRIFEAKRTNPARHAEEGSSNLFDAFATLDPTDQARISVPLDIVIKIFRGGQSR